MIRSSLKFYINYNRVYVESIIDDIFIINIFVFEDS